VIASPAVNSSAVNYASLGRRLFALVYESLLLTAVIAVAALPVVMLTHSWEHWLARAALQCYLLALCGVYFIWQWIKTGQTLAMKTWHMRVVTADGATLSLPRALTRYVIALFSLGLCGVSVLWALIDREKQFLHDRLAGTRIIDLRENPASW